MVCQVSFTFILFKFHNKTIKQTLAESMWGQRKEGEVTCNSTVGKTSHRSIWLAPKPVLFPTHKKGTKWNITHIWHSILRPFFKFPLFSQLRSPVPVFQGTYQKSAKGPQHTGSRDMPRRENLGAMSNHTT